MRKIRTAAENEAATYNNHQLLALFWLSEECDEVWRAALESEILGRMDDSLAAHARLARNLRVLAGILAGIAFVFVLVALVMAYLSFYVTCSGNGVSS